MAMSGAVARTAYLGRTVLGITTETGSTTRQVWASRVVSAGLTFLGTATGVLQRFWIRGAVTWRLLKEITSTLSFAGAATRFTHYRRQVISKRLLLAAGGWLELVRGGPLYLAQAKVLSFSGSATRKIITITQVSIAGVLNSVGAIARNLYQYRSVTGTLGFSATISRVRTAIHRGLASVVSFGGVASRNFIAYRPIAATLTFVGVHSRTAGNFFRSIAGTIIPIGVLRKGLFVTLASTLSFAGAVATVGGALYFRSLSAALSFAGTISRGTMQFKRELVGILASVATISYRVSQFIGGVLAFAGSAVRVMLYRRPADSVITMAATIARTGKYLKAITGELGFRGIGRRMGRFMKKGLSKLGFNLDAE